MIQIQINGEIFLLNGVSITVSPLPPSNHILTELSEVITSEDGFKFTQE